MIPRLALRPLFIWLRYFWPILPALFVAVGLAWVLWGLSPWLSLFLPAAAGVGTFFALSMMASAWGR